MLVQMRAAHVTQAQHLGGHVRRQAGLYNQLAAFVFVLPQSLVVHYDRTHCSHATRNRLVNTHRQLLHLFTIQSARLIFSSLLVYPETVLEYETTCHEFLPRMVLLNNAHIITVRFGRNDLSQLKLSNKNAFPTLLV